MRHFHLIALTIAFVLSVLIAKGWWQRQFGPVEVATAGGSAPALPVTTIPAAFVANQGQWNPRVRYAVRFADLTAFLESGGWTVAVKEPADAKRGPRDARRGVAINMRFVGGNSGAALVPGERLGGVHHYFVGGRDRWQRDVARYQSVVYREMYSGVDVRLRPSDGHLEYDVIVARGADLDPVEIEVRGADRVYVAADGALVMDTPIGPVRQPAPAAWEEDVAGDEPVVCRYVMTGPKRYSFVVPDRRLDRRLVIDPGLVYSTYLGGVGRLDVAHAVTVDQSGVATVMGWTESSSFPTTTGAYDTTHNGSQDVFVARLAAGGDRLVYSTYVGGADSEQPMAMAAVSDGTVVVAGSTRSTDFPTTVGAFDTSHNGDWDAFCFKLAAGGDQLVYSTVLGGKEFDRAYSVALDPAGAAYVVGETTGADFPVTTGCHDPTHNGYIDLFVARLAPAGDKLSFATYVGGKGPESAWSVAADANGAVVVGITESLDFPVTQGAYDTSHNGSLDAFALRLPATGDTLAFSTFLGGHGYAGNSPYAGGTRSPQVALDASGTVNIVGAVSGFIPTTPQAFDTSKNPGTDGFIQKLSAQGDKLLYGGYVGGRRTDEPWSFVLEPDGALTITGRTDSWDFPVTPGAFDTGLSLLGDCFVVRLTSAGDRLVYGSFVGGTSAEFAHAVAVGGDAVATLVGYTTSTNFPTTPGALKTAWTDPDAFVTRVRMIPYGVRRFGSTSQACGSGPTVHALDDAIDGRGTFGLGCTRAPANATGVLLLGTLGAPLGQPVAGVTSWLDLARPIVAMPATTNVYGESLQQLPIPSGSKGVRFFTQYAWGTTCGPLCASDALEVTVQ